MVKDPAKLKPLVYIASPYTRGDPAINTHFQCEIFDRLLSDGVVVPLVPLWSHFQHTLFPRPYKDWIELDLYMLHKCDALIRLASENKRLDYYHFESPGAEGEVAYMEKLGKPVFYSITTCYEHYNWGKP